MASSAFKQRRTPGVYAFLPRIRDVGDQRLYRLDRDTDYGGLNGVLRGTVDLALVRAVGRPRSGPRVLAGTGHSCPRDRTADGQHLAL
jgi:hypothetical protein